MPLKEK